MLYCNGIEISETSPSKECEISLYWYTLDKGFNFQWYICNGCHNVFNDAY